MDKQMKLTKEIINEKVEQLRKELLDMVEIKFEVGKWYKITDQDHRKTGVFYIKEIIKDSIKGYSKMPLEDWREENSFDIGSYYANNAVLATPSEVQSALEAEAVKRGFKEGVMFKCLEKGVVRPYRPYYKIEWDKGVKLTFRYYEDGDHLFCYDGLWCEGLDVCSNPSIYREGKWATIIPQEKTSEEWANEWQKEPLWNLNDWLNKNNLKITKK